MTIQARPVSPIEELISQGAAVNKSAQRFHTNRTKSEYGLFGHDCGLDDFNMVIGGWVPSKVTVIGGRSGSGKTALLTPMVRAANRVLQNRRAEILFLSWEVLPDFFVDRLISEDVGISVRMLNQGAKIMDDHTYKKVIAAYHRAKEISITYQQNSTNLSAIRKIYLKFVEDCHKKSKLEGVEIIPVCVIDYLQMAQFEGAAKNYAIGDFVNGLKKLANQTGGCFCLLAQLNRGEADKNPPQRGDVKDSADIEMACDNLILLHRPEYNNITEFPDGSDTKDRMMVRFVKTRDGEPQDRYIACEVRHNRFYNESHHYGFEYWKEYSKPEFWYKQLLAAEMPKQEHIQLSLAA